MNGSLIRGRRKRRRSIHSSYHNNIINSNNNKNNYNSLLVLRNWIWCLVFVSTTTTPLSFGFGLHKLPTTTHLLPTTTNGSNNKGITTTTTRAKTFLETGATSRQLHLQQQQQARPSSYSHGIGFGSSRSLSSSLFSATEASESSQTRSSSSSSTTIASTAATTVDSTTTTTATTNTTTAAVIESSDHHRLHPPYHRHHHQDDPPNGHNTSSNTSDSNNNNNKIPSLSSATATALDNTVSYADVVVATEVVVEEEQIEDTVSVSSSNKNDNDETKNETSTTSTATSSTSTVQTSLPSAPTALEIDDQNSDESGNNKKNNNDKETTTNTTSSTSATNTTTPSKMATTTTSGTSSSSFTDEDRKFLDRVRASVRTVQNWDNTTELLRQCRTVIPWDDLRNKTGPYSREESDWMYCDNPDALFLQRFCRWFQSFMSWVNSPPCRVCGSTECEMKTVRGPITDEERDGEAKRVEVYYCPQCKENTTTFPRYNKASKLLETRKGRCGEYSNLFGLFCRSVGYETRLVLDLSDHLWTEIRLTNGRDETWVMADACEGVIDKASMYEHGWGKDTLCYMIAIGHDHVVDVTSRYTRKYLTDDFQSRRRQHTSSEEMSEQLIHRVNAEIESNRTIAGLPPMPKARREELDRRSKIEQAELRLLRQQTEWTEQEKYGRGRMSGSLQWRQMRGEIQQSDGDGNSNNNSAASQVAGFEVEAFVPSSPSVDNGKVVLRVQSQPSSRYGGIEVSGTPCAIGESNSISVVVVDEAPLGTILQSKSFVAWSEVSKFVDSLPSNRIVLMNGKIEIGNETKSDHLEKDIMMDRLGGWNGTTVAHEGVLFVGQVDANPDWAFCDTLGDGKSSKGYELELLADSDTTDLSSSLRTERGSVPQRVTGRLPSAFMPLSQQLNASEQEKRSAYLSFVASNNRHKYSGYTTKLNSPIYLLNSTAYPLQRMDETTIDVIGKGNVWNTFLSLPPTLVPEDDHGIVQPTGHNRLSINVPMDVSFFKNSLGPTLLTEGKNRLPTEQVLANSRLIGLYFSGSWCGPCRQFTPLLAEMYSHLADTYPTNGLEIVFVSSDRDLGSFERYFSSHPWKAIPFDHLQLVKHSLNMTYGVRGIPSLVILDAVSGRVVVPASQSRQEVMTACNQGEHGIERLFESWIGRVPVETQELIQMLELSIEEDSATKETESSEDHPYLKRPTVANTKESESNKGDLASQVKMHFERLMKSGEHDPNSAAARALSLAGGGSTEKVALPSGDLDGKATYIGPPRLEDHVDIALVQALDRNPPSSVCGVLSTAQKYLKNVIEKPFEPKFRAFRLSNKVADSITGVEGGWELLHSLGFEVVSTSHDFKATIPVSADTESMEKRIDQLIKDIGQ